MAFRSPHLHLLVSICCLVQAPAALAHPGVHGLESLRLLGQDGPGESPPKPNGTRCRIRNVRVPDGKGDYGEPTTLVIADGVIGAWGGAVPPGADPAGVNAVDARGGFLLPGLVDAHGHVGQPEAFERLPSMLRAGVTGVIDLASDEKISKRARSAPLDLRFVGPMFTAQGGHGTEAIYGIDCHPLKPDTTQRDAETTLRRAWPPAFLSEGIKIIHDGMIIGSGGRPVPTDHQLNYEQLLGLFEGAIGGFGDDGPDARRIHVHVGFDFKAARFVNEILKGAASLAKKGKRFHLVLEHWDGFGLVPLAAGDARKPPSPLVDRQLLTEILQGGRCRLSVTPTYVRVLPPDRNQRAGALRGGAVTLQQLRDDFHVTIQAGTDFDATFPADLTEEIGILAEQLTRNFSRTGAETPGNRTTRGVNYNLLLNAAFPHRPHHDLINKGQIANLAIYRDDPIADLNRLKVGPTHVFVRGQVHNISTKGPGE
jgi:hypothetical protein